MRAALHIIMAIFIANMAILGPFSPATHAGPAGERYASISVDADNQSILHARQIDEPRFPASLTKMMTLYLTFDALDAGTLKLDSVLSTSSYASGAPAVKLGLRAGEKLTVHQAIQALAVKSSNDVAVVLAERIGGTEAGFAQLMSAKARSLGMSATTYRNASGLPNPNQITTARDQAKLADSLMRHHPQYYHYFGQQSFVWKGRTLKNHNTLLGTVAGVDGFKTGYTNASGYNLTISAQRNGRRIIAVVLGGASGAARDQHMARLIDRSFEVIGQQPVQIATNTPSASFTRKVIREPAPVQAFEIRGRSGKDVQLVTGDGADAALCRVLASEDKSCIVVRQ